MSSADGDTTAVITHNLGLTAAQLAAYQPFVRLTALLSMFYLSAWTIAYTDGNTITLTKSTTGGSGNAGIQVVVTIERPYSTTI